jgi:adenylate cyclase, class 2
VLPEFLQVLLVAHLVRKVDVDVRRRLLRRVVVELVDRQGEDLSVAREQRGGPVAVVHVAVHDHCPFDAAFPLQAPDGNRHVVHRAEPLAVPMEGVVEPASDVEAQAIAQRQARGESCAAGRQPEGPDHLPGVRDFQLQDLVKTQRSGAKAADPPFIVNQNEVLFRGWLGCYEISGARELLGQHPLADEAVFLGGKHMIAEVEVIAFVVDKPERKHETGRLTGECIAFRRVRAAWRCGFKDCDNTRNMSLGGAATETEIKLRLQDAAGGRRLLRACGFRCVRRRIFESNVLYDTAAGELRSLGVILRVRQAGGKALLTYKGPSTPAKHKTREEIETYVSNPMELRKILELLGYQPVFWYEKYRTEYQDFAGRGVVMLDETPVGVFLELEGPPDWIDLTARRLGFSESDYITMSYASIYLDDCAARGISPKHMVFPKSGA